MEKRCCSWSALLVLLSFLLFCPFMLSIVSKMANGSTFFKSTTLNQADPKEHLLHCLRLACLATPLSAKTRRHFVDAICQMPSLRFSQKMIGKGKHNGNTFVRVTNTHLSLLYWLWERGEPTVAICPCVFFVLGCLNSAEKLLQLFLHADFRHHLLLLPLRPAVTRDAP